MLLKFLTLVCLIQAIITVDPIVAKEQDSHCPIVPWQFNGTVTTLQFPKGRGAKPKAITCTYSITNTNGLPITFIVSELDLSSALECTNDYVKVSNDKTFKDGLTYSTCAPNNRLNRVFTSTKNVMYLQIKTNSSKAQRKVVATYYGGQYERCPYVPPEFDGTATVLRFPDGQDVENTEFTCTYKITNSKRMTIKFDMSELELPSTANCTNDYVKVSNRPDFKDGLTFSNCTPYDKMTKSFNSTTKSMYLQIKVSKLEAQSKMVASYRGIQKSWLDDRCPNLDPIFDGELTYFYFPKNYNGNEGFNCTYKITNIKRSSITFVMSELKLLSTSNCTEDYVKVSNNNKFTDGFTYSACTRNDTINKVFTSQADVMYLQTMVTQLNGFIAIAGKYYGGQYERCPYVTTEFDGTATELKFPNGRGAHKRDFTCTYKIINTIGKKIKFDLSELELPSTANCTNDYVRASNRPDFTDGLTYSNCISYDQLAKSFTSTTNVMYLRIKVSKLEAQSKMVASYRGINAETPEITCPTKPLIASDSKQKLIIPGENKNIPFNYSCAYVIKAPGGKLVQQKLTRFRIGERPQCTRGIWIGEGELPNDKNKYFHCGNFSVLIPINNLPAIWIQLKGTGFTSDEYLTLEYWSVPIPSPYFECPSKPIVLNQFPYEMVIPPWNKRFPANLNCTFLITTTGMKLINAKFKNLNIGSSDSCEQKYAVVGLGDKPFDPIQWRLCGYGIPHFTYTNQTTIFVILRGKGFDERDRFTLSFY